MSSGDMGVSVQAGVSQPGSPGALQWRTGCSQAAFILHRPDPAEACRCTGHHIAIKGLAVIDPATGSKTGRSWVAYSRADTSRTRFWSRWQPDAFTLW